MVMGRNSAWRKNNNREIKHTWERYIAIIAIITLGVGFFSGLKVTKTAMVNNLDNYVTQYQMYDYRLISSLGLTKYDVQFFDSQEDITAEGALFMDIIADINRDGEEKSIVLKAHSITNTINKLNIQQGTMPAAGNECLLDSSYFTKDIIGTKLRISSDNEEATLDSFKYNEYTVVGIARSVNYLNYDRGTTSLASGSIDAFVYLPEEGFSTDYYTEIMLRLESEGGVYSKQYQDMISEKEEPLKQVLEVRADLRYQEIVKEANDVLEKAQMEYDEGYATYILEKADAEAKLEEARAKLVDAKQEIVDNEEKLKDADVKLAKAFEEYQEGLISYEEGLREYEAQKVDVLASLEESQEELDQNRKAVVSAMTQIEESGVLTQYSQLTEGIARLELALSQLSDHNSVEYLTTKGELDQVKAGILEIESTGIINQYTTLQESRLQIEEGQEELNQGKEEATTQLADAKKKLTDAKKKLDLGYEEINENKLSIQEGWDALEEGKAEYNKGLVEYEDGKEEADEGFADAKLELDQARIQITDAKSEIQEIPEPKVFVLDRNYNSGYANFDNDSSIVDGIAKFLPIFFFLVAALVCTTTMTRMVDEQRTQIGTLKALGYSNGAITRKYMTYSGSAAMIGCVIGYFLGTKFFPMAIWKAYGMLYDFSSIEYVFDLKLAVISLIVSFLCSAGVTYISCKSELLQMPASLIRPKAPKAGKRVLLERLPFLWKRVSFLHKVSIRNILRYKRRFFMTVTGIAGCTALIVTALGIRDSIKNIANDQFGSIMIYDLDISFSEELSEEDRESFILGQAEVLSECVFISTHEMEIVQGNQIKKASIIATDDPDISKVIGMHYEGKTVSYPTLGKVVISNKLAKDLSLEVGETLTIRMSPTKTANVEVDGIFDNYVGNYLLMTGETYGEIFEEEPTYKNAYAISNEEDIYSVSAVLRNVDSITMVNVTNDIRAMVDNMMQSLDAVIWLVIACAGALGFVVIYNLNNINITERGREIATLKVIGFYQKETGAYVFRETITLTLIGALFGLGLGKLLHMFIMSQINVEMVSFKEQIFGISYLLSFVLTFIITLLINWMLRRKIDRINMAESLKSVE